MPDHRLTLTSRNRLTVTGVTEVLTFDETYALLQTPQGPLTVHGTDLQLKTLTPDTTTATIEGQIDALTYDPPKPTPLLKRLFH